MWQTKARPRCHIPARSRHTEANVQRSFRLANGVELACDSICVARPPSRIICIKPGPGSDKHDICAEHGAAWSGDAAQTSCLLLIDSGAIRLYVTPSERGRCSPRDVARANRKAVGNENCRISPDETPPNCAPGIIRLRREYRQRAARPAPARTCDSADPAALEIGSCREDNTGITAALRPDVRVLGACALPVQGMRRKRTRLPRAVRGAPCL
jgi:hypothetical protein